MKTMHILDETEHLSLKQHMAASHYIYLTGTLILAVIQFVDGKHAEAFGIKSKTASHLPHPVYEGSSLISEQQAQALSQCAELFPECATPEDRLAAARKCSTSDVCKRARALHPLMRLGTF
jgi:hypothetical protein